MSITTNNKYKEVLDVLRCSHVWLTAADVSARADVSQRSALRMLDHQVSAGLVDVRTNAPEPALFCITDLGREDHAGSS